MAIFKNLFVKPLPCIGSPVAGQSVPLSQVNDPTFSHEILGRGVAVLPTDGKVYAPCDACVDVVFPTGHAISLITPAGAEVLMHIGLETVNLHGKHFTVHTAIGSHVKKGQLLLEFDLEALKQDGYDPIIPIVVCNSNLFNVFHIKTGNSVKPGDTLIELDK